jgi:hypothetical protein
MVPSEEFLRHAAECEYMARFSHDPQSKAAWHGMAERWVRCAELAKKQDHERHKVRAHRKTNSRWSH